MTDFVSIIASALVALPVVLIATPIVRRWSQRFGLLDVPNQRSSHRVPTPRSGGYAIVLGLASALSTGWVMGVGPLGAFLAVPIVTLSGFIDDVRPLREWQKLLFQVSGALAWILLSGDTIHSVQSGGWRFNLDSFSGVVVTLFWLVGFTNAFNFMDGINGIASGQAIIAGLVLAIIAWQRGESVSLLIAGAIVFASAGFLPFNFPNGSIFMGDTGSATLGFLIAVLVARQAPQDVIPAILPLLPFLFDTSLTLLSRIALREAWFRAHRGHLYQRLTDIGWSHAQVTGAWTSAAAACGVVALFWRQIVVTIGGLIPLMLLLAAFSLGALGILARHRRLKRPTTISK